MAINRIIVAGNVTKAPELVELASGKRVAKFNVAVNKRWRNPQGEVVDSATFVPIIAWERRGEFCARYLERGSPVLIDGELRISSYRNAEGQSRWRTEVVASGVQFLGRPRSRTPEGEAAGGRASTGRESVDADSRAIRGSSEPVNPPEAGEDEREPVGDQQKVLAVTDGEAAADISMNRVGARGRGRVSTASRARANHRAILADPGATSPGTRADDEGDVPF